MYINTYCSETCVNLNPVNVEPWLIGKLFREQN